MGFLPGVINATPTSATDAKVHTGKLGLPELNNSVRRCMFEYSGVLRFCEVILSKFHCTIIYGKTENFCFMANTSVC